jgi:hypothetical protein
MGIFTSEVAIRANCARPERLVQGSDLQERLGDRSRHRRRGRCARHCLRRPSFRRPAWRWGGLGRGALRLHDDARSRGDLSPFEVLPQLTPEVVRPWHNVDRPTVKLLAPIVSGASLAQRMVWNVALTAPAANSAAGQTPRRLQYGCAVRLHRSILSSTASEPDRQRKSTDTRRRAQRDWDRGENGPHRQWQKGPAAPA